MADEENEDNLITYREFIKAIKSKALQDVYKRILPRTLAFRDVLICTRTERTYEVCDTHVDDFAMFRYEINSIFKQHQFLDEKPSELFMGPNPLSKNKIGKQFKELDEQSKQNFSDMYRPPGIVRIRDNDKSKYHGSIAKTSHSQFETAEAQTHDVSKIDKNIW